MWKKLCDGDIIDVFQYDTQVGSQAIKKIKPQSIVELAVANSVMRLMSSDGGELPLETYVRFKNNINLWYNEMRLHGLNNEEIAVLEKYLKPLSGVADSQEAAMLLSMDPNIAGFSVKDANKLRKAIAKKKADVMEEVRQLFYSMGTERGTSQAMLDYVWKVQMLRQAGYSFSVLHTMGYSTIALQEMNLVHQFPDIYWKTACLSTNANAVNEEDYEFLIEEEIITELDEEDKKEGNKVQYGKVASALIDFKQQDTKIILPNINKSKLGFAPDLENNAILFGLKGITKIGTDLIMEIFKRRPFASLNDFINKMNSGEKSLISKDKIVKLIKSGCSNKVEKKGR
jgi:DNA polymerase-3 subunit alpha